MSTIKPRSAQELTDAIAWALDRSEALEIGGGFTKRALGKPSRAAQRLDLADLRGISLYEPEELVLTAAAGTPLAEIESVLAQRNQMLAFEPPDLAGIFGAGSGQTLGGVIACNFAGPRRLSHGAARDHFLGFKGTSGRGERFKSGGRVVKNVTGYDLSKLLAGSHGTLAALDEITVKVLPAPEKTRTILLLGLDDAQAVQALCRAMGQPVDVSGAAHLPARAAQHSAVDYVRNPGTAVTALRLEGPGPSVEARCLHLRLFFAGQCAIEELHSVNSVVLWKEIRDLRLLGGPDHVDIWKVSVAPAEGAAVAARIRSAIAGAENFYDWSGGLIFVALPPAQDASATIVRAALGEGHATLLRAPDAVRQAVPVFHPQPAPLAALSARVKDAFDPTGILNAGRMG